MSAPASPPSGDDELDFEIELEPSLTAEATSDYTRPGDPSARVALVAGGPVSVGSEATALLHDRIQAAALAFVVLYAIVFPLNLYFRSEMPAIIVTMGLRLLLAVGVYGAMRASARWTLGQLRWFELGLFGGLTLLLMVSQYYGNREYIAQHDLASMVAYERNGVLNLCITMMLYAVFIPNDAKRCAEVVLTMAMGPLLVLAVVLERDAVEVLTPSRHFIALHSLGNAVSILFVAGLAIYCTHVLNRLRTELREARKFGHYRLVQKLGSGGMGDVYLAEHELLKRPCALKLIKSDVQTNPVALARFEREVQSAARLSNPHVIEIFDYGHTDDGTFYYVMEYLAGMSLHELVARFGPLPPGRAIYLARQVCMGLAEAHTLGLVHRDLKPANIFVAIRGGEYDVAKVLDFGLVKLAPGEGAELTADHTVSGTPSYMAPEQATGQRDIDGRADIYAVGAVLYFMMTGRPPFEGGSPMAVMIAHARDPVVPPRVYRPDIPADLEEVILQCLAKSPGDRYPNARALAKVLAACSSANEWSADRAGAWWYAQADKAQSLAPEVESLTVVEAVS